jgi:predicted transposase YbfD/YdcC
VEVGAKTNEIPLFTTLLDLLDIADAVITAGALHAQREHARYLARRGAHYVITVKGNQPSLHAQLAALPWRDVPVAHDKRERGHGRRERRTLKVTAVARGLAFPHAAGWQNTATSPRPGRAPPPATKAPPPRPRPVSIRPTTGTASIPAGGPDPSLCPTGPSTASITSSIASSSPGR